MKILYDGYEVQKYRHLIDFFCQRVAAYNHQRENQMKITNDQIVFFNYHKLLYQKSQKKNCVLWEILIVLTHNVSFFLCMRDDDY